MTANVCIFDTKIWGYNITRGPYSPELLTSLKFPMLTCVKVPESKLDLAIKRSTSSKVTILTNLLVLEYSMLQIKFQDHQFTGFGEETFSTAEAATMVTRPEPFP